MVPQGRTEYVSYEIFGKNENVTTSYSALTTNGIYNMPLIADAKQLRIKAGGDAGDTLTGLGARTVTLSGVDVDLRQIRETIALNGASASSLTSKAFLRLHEARVSASGTHGTAVDYSHIAAITIEDSGGVEWAEIPGGDIPHGLSHIGGFTIPLFTFSGIPIKEGYVRSYLPTVDTGKSMDLVFLVIGGALTNAAPFTPVLLQRQHLGFNRDINVVVPTALGPILPGTDVVPMVRGPSTPAVALSMQYALVKGNI